jgi:acetoacetate decarboxylase
MSVPGFVHFLPRGATRCVDREYLVVVCESDPAAIRCALPRPLQPDGSNTVCLRFVATHGTAGTGSQVETDLVIPARFEGTRVDFTAQRYADETFAPFAADAGRRAAWPHRPGHTRLLFMRETAAAVLEIGGRAVVLAEMGHGRHGSAGDDAVVCPEQGVRRRLAGTQVDLKRIAAANGRAAVAQLVAVQLQDIRVKAAWAGPARLHRSGSGAAPIADFPLRRIVAGIDFVADLTLARSEVLFDYKREARRSIAAAWTQLAASLAPRLQEAA